MHFVSMGIHYIYAAHKVKRTQFLLCRLLAFVLYCLLWPCQALATSTTPYIVVIEPPIHALVADIMRGSAGRAYPLFTGNNDIHANWLSAEQRAHLQQADLIISADRAQPPALQRYIDQALERGSQWMILNEQEAADALPVRKENAWLTTQPTDDNASSASADDTPDMHLWLDPLRMATLLTDIARILGELYPAYARGYELHAEALSAHLRDDVHPALINIFEAHRTPSRAKATLPVIVYHDAYQYLEQRYGLPHYGHIAASPGSMINAEQMQQLIQAAETYRVRCLISEHHNAMLARLALLSDAKRIRLSPECVYTAKDAPALPWIRNDYDRLMAKTATIFAACLRGNLPAESY